MELLWEVELVHQFMVDIGLLLRIRYLLTLLICLDVHFFRFVLQSGNPKLSIELCSTVMHFAYISLDVDILQCPQWVGGGYCPY